MAFRDVIMKTLYELPDFVHRSRYGNGDETEHADKVPEICEEENETGVPDQKIDMKDAKKYAEEALRRIGKEFSVKVITEQRIIGSSAIFDGVFRRGEEIYGIEVYCGYNKRSLRERLDRMSAVSLELPPKIRAQFCPVLCVISANDNDQWRNDLCDMVKELGYRGIVRTYSVKELTQN